MKQTKPPLIVAHRGSSKAEQENTIAAFARARVDGAGMVELDVRRTRVGELVIHHDAAIDGLGNIVDLDHEALPAYIPTLADALDACVPMRVNIEIKNMPDDPDFDRSDRVAQQVEALLRERGDGDRMLISSFNFDTVAAIRRLDPLLATGLLFMVPTRTLRDVAAAGHVAIHPHHRAVNADLVDQAHSFGLAVNTWTVDDPDRMRALAVLGVDAIITNVPAVAVQALGLQ